MKRRFSSILLALSMVLGMMPAMAFADGTDPITVYLTVSNKGALAQDNDGKPMAWKEVTVTDLDNDGSFTYHEALVAAHAAYNSDSGYDAGSGFVNKLWGVTTSNLLFFVNGQGLPTGVKQDTVSAGDYLVASINKDDATYSDWFSFFDVNTLSLTTGESAELVLKGYQGMTGGTASVLKDITVKAGDLTIGKTDENGVVQVSFTDEGTYILTANGTVEGVATDWNIYSFAVDGGAPFGWIDYNTGDSYVAYTVKDYGSGPYPASEVLYMDFFDWNDLSDEELENVHALQSNKLIVECPLIPAVCIVTVAKAPAVHKDDVAAEVQAMLDELLADDSTRNASTYNADWALAVRAAGKTPTKEQLDHFKTNAMNAAKSASTSVATKAKWAIALSALGIDATQIPGEGDEIINLVRDVYSSKESDITSLFGPDAYVAPFIINLYRLGVYNIPDDALSEEFLIDLILSGQGADGGWYSSWGTDAAGMVLPALAVISGSDEVDKAKEKAVAYLSSAQANDGSMGNIWSTVMASMGLHAAGINDHSSADFFKDACVTDYILSQKSSISAATLVDQTVWALASLQNLDNDRSANVYHFDASVSVCTDWPNAKLLTAIGVTTQPTKTTYTVGETFDPAGLVVTATYNADAQNTAEIASGYTLSAPDMTTSGNKTVTVTYQGLTAKFVISVTDGSTPVAETASLTVKDLTNTVVSVNSCNIVAGETTAIELLKSVLDSEGIAYVIKNNGTYVSSINGLSEFDEGPNSGWLYKVNGKLPTYSAAEYKLRAGDSVLFYYTQDWTKDQDASSNAGLTKPIEEEKPTFIDVADDAYYAEAVDWAVENGITAGTSETTFGPDLGCTRAQIMTFLWIAKGSKDPSSSDNPFGDVKKGSYYEKAVLWAIEQGITAGVSADLFGSDKTCTRAQAVTFLWLAMGAPEPSDENPFDDVKEGSYYEKAVRWALEKGITAGTSANTFSPDQECTRAQIVTYLWLAMK